VLTASGELSLEATEALRAGALKLARAPNAKLILDLSELNSPLLSDARFQERLTTLQSRIESSGKQVIICGKIPGVSEAENAEQAAELIKNPESREKNKEKRLKSQIALLTARKGLLEKNYSSVNIDEAETLKLKKENSKLRKLIATLDQRAKFLLDSQAGETFKLPTAIQLKWASLMEAVTKVGETQGFAFPKESK
jgi:hypothetical protein